MSEPWARMQAIGGTTLATIKGWLRKTVREDRKPAICPACGQHVAIYRRQVNAMMAAQLIGLYRHNGTRSGEIRIALKEAGLIYGSGGGDVTKLRYWGLIEREEGERDDGSKRVGVWRVTKRGVRFIVEVERIPRVALVYNGAFLGYEDESDTLGIREALGERFDYAELLGRAAMRAV